MDELTKYYMGLHIERLIEEFKFDNRNGRKNECPCYETQKPCHDTENLNCLLCYCPWYEVEKDEGGCKINNPLEKGKFIPYSNNLPGKIWDCTECDYPNKEETVRKFLWELFTGKLANKEVL